MSARIEPVPTIADGLLAKARRAVGGPIRPEANVYRTLATYPDLFVAWLALGGHLLRNNTLPAQRRELVILRTALLAGGRYPATQHARIAAAEGVPDHEISRIADDPAEAGWEPEVLATLTAADQLYRRGTVDDTTSTTLARSLPTPGILDLVATVAFYRMAAWMLNACRTPLDDGQHGADVTDRRARPTAASTDASITNAAVGIDPLPLERWPADLRDRTAGWPRFRGRPEIRRAGVYGTLANHPPLFVSLGPIMAHLLVDNSLSDEQREVVIVRSCLLDRGAYPYRQHVGIAAASGVDEHSLRALAEPEPALDDPTLATLVAAVDELHRTDDLSDPTWARLCRHLGPQQIMDLIVTAGFYGLISFALNTSRTPLEAGTIDLPPAPFEKGSPT